MRKRTGENEQLIYLRKAIAINDLEIVTRMSNNVIQLHFSDLSSLAINREDEKGIYYIDRKGKQIEVNYNQCKSSKLKTKVRRFSNLIQKLSARGEEGEEDLDDNPSYDSYEESGEH
jgi:hypothetical protein